MEFEIMLLNLLGLVRYLDWIDSEGKNVLVINL